MSIPSTDLRLALVVATKDRPRELAALLASLAGQTVRPHQVVVVDSGNRSVEDVVMQWSGALTVLYVTHFPPSASVQRNVGVEAVNPSCGLIGFLDDDCVLADDGIAAMRQFWAQAPPDVGGAGFNLQTHEATEAQWLKHSRLSRRLGLYDVRPGYVSKGGWQTMIGTVAEDKEVQWLPSTAVVWRRKVFERFKFEEYFDGYSYLEDLDFSYAVGQEYRLVVVAAAAFWHNQSPRGRVGGFEFGRVEVRNRLFFVEKHGLSATRCWFGLIIRLLMTVGRGAMRLKRRAIARATGNIVALFRYGVLRKP